MRLLHVRLLHLIHAPFASEKGQCAALLPQGGFDPARNSGLGPGLEGFSPAPGVGEGAPGRVLHATVTVAPDRLMQLLHLMCADSPLHAHSDACTDEAWPCNSPP